MLALALATGLELASVSGTGLMMKPGLRPAELEPGLVEASKLAIGLDLASVTGPVLRLALVAAMTLAGYLLLPASSLPPVQPMQQLPLRPLSLCWPQLLRPLRLSRVQQKMWS